MTNLVELQNLLSSIRYKEILTINDALSIFKELKKHEMFINGKRDINNEFEKTKQDIILIFGNEYKDKLKNMTKNQIYMLHQSLICNAIYINRKELNANAK
jgi:hypothetical protein